MDSVARDISDEAPARGDSGSFRALVMTGIALVGGAAAGINLCARYSGDEPTAWGIIWAAALGGAGLFLVAVVAAHLVTRRVLARLDAATAARFRRCDFLTYLPLLLTLTGIGGFRFMPIVLIILLVMLAKGVALYACLPARDRQGVFTSLGWLAFLFLISGFAALIYQIVWQRTLFAAFGVNIESITLIVGLFMFGLGLGSLVGGVLTKRYPTRAPLLFLICECGIGLFGVISLPLIDSVSAATLHLPMVGVACVVFALLVIPTMLMGATLPILVGHLHRTYHSVGRSVGILYCINTVGSAIACFLTADLLFVIAGQQAAVIVAAVCNLVVGVLVWQYARSIGRRGQQGEAEAAGAEGPAADLAETPTYAWRGADAAFVVFFAAATGYISLSQEILWMRVVSYMTKGLPSVFAHVLGFFLIGVAAGALYGKRICEKHLSGPGTSPARFVGGMLLVSGVFYYVAITATASLHAAAWPLGLVATHLVVAVVSFLLGGIFPILCHYGARAGKDVGITVSRLYVANIVGSTLGPMVTGFVLMDYFTTDQLILGLAVAAIALGGAAFVFAGGRGAIRPVGLAAVAVAAMFVVHDGAYDMLFERILQPPEPVPFKYNVEDRGGVVSVGEEGAPGKGDICYGGGAYDGRFTVDPVRDSNGIRRCYMLAALHREPADVLEIGLSTASWSRVIADHRKVKKLTIVEIGGSYFDVIKQYPDQQSVVDEAKKKERIEIIIDDGRRWLNRHPDRKFDFILQNTTWHWRSSITNLISEEYLELVKRHLKPGGVFYYNSTSAPEIPFTAAHVFKHVVLYGNFVAASDSPFDMTDDEKRQNLLQFVNRREEVVFRKPGHSEVLQALATGRLVDEGPALRARRDLVKITDDNMLTEYKCSHCWPREKLTWGALFNRCNRKQE